MQQERLADALADCKAAYEIRNSPENAVILARVLATAGPNRDEPRAKSLLRSALPNADFAAATLICELATQLDDMLLVDQCAARLRTIDESSWETQLFTAIAAGFRGEFEDARRALDRAHEAGLEDATYEVFSKEFSEMLADAEPPVLRYGKQFGWVWLLWIGLAAGLIAAGIALSRMTLSEANRVLTNPEASAHATESRLHKAYATVLWLTCAFYYLSVPLVLLSLVALGAGIILMFLYIGHMPIKFAVIVVVVVCGSVFAVIKSFFAKASDSAPGLALDLSEAPGLRQTLDEVAAKVGTRPVDHVYLEVGADIAVFERGGLLAKLRGKGERCLVLGIAVLEGMDMQAFKAILAHEYGHFSNDDTAGGNFALAVRRSIMNSAHGLAMVGAADWYNPAWLFLNGFHKLFLHISQGASRLQEVLADRWSARCYGASSFERGLRHVIAVDLRFDAHANAVINEAAHGGGVLRNIYQYTPAKGEIEASELEAKLQEAVDAEPSPYDSHPRPADRFRWARAIAQRDQDDCSAEPAWALFSDRAEIEEWLTGALCERVRAQTGVQLHAAEP